MQSSWRIKNRPSMPLWVVLTIPRDKINKRYVVYGTYGKSLVGLPSRIISKTTIFGKEIMENNSKTDYDVRMKQPDCHQDIVAKLKPQGSKKTPRESWTRHQIKQISRTRFLLSGEDLWHPEFRKSLKTRNSKNFLTFTLTIFFPLLTSSFLSYFKRWKPH